MNKMLCIMSIAMALLLQACGQQAATHSRDQKDAMVAAASKVVNAHAEEVFTKYPLQRPIAGFYMPSFPYAFRAAKYDRKGDHGSYNVVDFEFSGIALADACHSIKQRFELFGYKATRTKQSKKYCRATFVAKGRSQVFVSVSDIGKHNPLVPGAVGIVYFSWPSTQ